MFSAHMVVSLFFPLIRWCLKLESWPEKLLFWNQHRTFLQIALQMQITASTCIINQAKQLQPYLY
jgi:hypothetical protein